ncbi:platelet endothelial cell adhesion molecule [Rana temporaria]|uniref:platelet endothelial cell adhesion molecule n=1 Tax=Rana temporaria TaxID=8407 RepID=UPI001AACC021|nr:platelet endothelial cell adhesion molecule [Rana temporaria]
MYLAVVLLLAPWMVGGQSVNFTINSIELQALPSKTIINGDNLQLKCLVDIAKIGHFVLASTFTFFKDDNLIHNVTTTSSEAIYTIQNASVSRSGFYKCQINAETRHKTSEEIKVKVTGLSAPLISITKMEVSEGDEITVRCEAPNEEPPMTFNFYKTVKERGLPKRKRAPNTNYAETTYEIKEGESILHFECTLKLMIEDEPESPLSRRQTVTVVEPFSTPTITVRPSNNFTEGAVMEVTCTVQKSYRRSEVVSITLQKGNQILKASNSERLTYSQVATVSDMGNYTCKAEGRTASKTTSAMVKVKELFPRPRLTLKQMNNKTEFINDGDLVTLECSVSSLPPQESSKQDFYLIVNKGERRHMRRGGKFMMHLRSADSGDYKCEVTIANITKTSEQVPVKVYAPVTKPELKQIIKDNKMVVLGDTLILTCRSPTGTPPIEYTLYREGVLLESKEKKDNSEVTFMVNTTKLHDLGHYQCSASNRNQKSSALSEVLNVTVITPVREVSLLIIPGNGEVEEGAELSLVCEAKYGTLPLTFYFYVKKGAEILLRNVTETDIMHAQHTVSLFTKEKDGAYFCKASNKANKIASSGSVEVKAILARWKAAVIATFVFVIIVAAIAIALYLYLDKKKKGKNILSDSSRSSKAVNSSGEKSAADVKSDDSYFGSVQNEEELHILRTAEETNGNNQQNHEVEYTEADGSAPDPHHDSVENNSNENPNTNNLT